MTVDVFADEHQMAAELDGVPWTRPTLFGINGMGSAGNDFGFASDLCNAVDHEIWRTVVIDYSAAAFPMGPSVREGVDKMVNAILNTNGHKAMVGYSEGAMVVGRVWRDECLNPNGRLHQQYLNGLIVIVVPIGDALRTPGIAKGNEVAGVPIPGHVDGVMTGGISGTNCLTPEETGDIVFSCTNTGDVYGAAPTGPDPWNNITGVGHDMQLCFDFVQDVNVLNIFGFVQEIMTMLGIQSGISLYTVINVMQGVVTGMVDGLTNMPVPVTGATTPMHVAWMVQAVLSFGMFVLGGFGPHGDYGKFIPAIAAHVNNLGHPYATI